ncbi:MAG: UDP-N-acetylmuramoyl-L-alanine--D-glutamate ligase, partial [Acidiferrobacterales bacterium]
MARNLPKTALVLGLGATGLSCARYLSAQGYRVRAADSRPTPPMLSSLRAEFPDMPVHTGPWDSRLFRETDLLVVSPGLSLRDPEI